MPAKYDQDAVELCRKLYCKYGGRNHDAIQSEMQKVYPGWRRSNLVDRGRGKNRAATLGWISEYGFDNSLKLHLQKLTESVNDDEQDLYLGIKTVRQNLQPKALSGKATKDEFYQYRDFCKLEIEARKNLDLSRDNLETFVSGYEKQVMWLGEIDPEAAKLLIRNGEKLMRRAQTHYGGTQSSDDGATDRPDEGGK